MTRVVTIILCAIIVAVAVVIVILSFNPRRRGMPVLGKSTTSMRAQPPEMPEGNERSIGGSTAHTPPAIEGLIRESSFSRLSLERDRAFPIGRIVRCSFKRFLDRARPTPAQISDLQDLFQGTLLDEYDERLREIADMGISDQRFQMSHDLFAMTSERLTDGVRRILSEGQMNIFKEEIGEPMYLLDPGIVSDVSSVDCTDHDAGNTEDALFHSAG